MAPLEETTARLGVGVCLPLRFEQLPLLRTLAACEDLRLYFGAGGGAAPEERFSAQLLQQEHGEDAVQRLLAAETPEALAAAQRLLNLDATLAATVLVHRDIHVIKELGLAQRVHPCVVRLQQASPTVLAAAFREAELRFKAVGVDAEVRTSTVLAQW